MSFDCRGLVALWSVFWHYELCFANKSKKVVLKRGMREQDEYAVTLDLSTAVNDFAER